MLRPVFAFERRLPAWLRPTARGVACILELGTGVAGMLYMLALLGVMIVLVGPGAGVVLLGAFLGLLMAAGAVGGTIHGLLPSLEEWGRLGAWLRAAVAIFGAMLAFVGFTPQGPFTLLDPEVYVIAGMIAASGAGYFLLLDDRRPGRATPGRLRWQQNHERLRATAERTRARRRLTRHAGRDDVAWLAESTSGRE